MLPAFGNPHELTEIEDRLAEAPDDVSLLFSRAYLLDLLGRNSEARDAYIAVIKRDGSHIGFGKPRDAPLQCGLAARHA